VPFLSVLYGLAGQLNANLAGNANAPVR
jgi:2-dehydropantoate 2-reductase